MNLEIIENGFAFQPKKRNPAGETKSKLVSRSSPESP